MRLHATVLCPGRASGKVLVLSEPLSFWGGLDPRSGEIIDRWHKQSGTMLSRTILVMRSGRGSSSGSTVLAESIRLGTAPAAILLAEPDPIITVGALVADELYGLSCPVLVLAEEAYRACESAQFVEILADSTPGSVEIRSL